MISQNRLKELVSYDEITGIFTWAYNRSKRKVGNPAGYKDARGYMAMLLDGNLYKSHRMAFLYVTGELPKELVDHKNMIRDDNSWSNLREASHIENQRNQGKPSTNTSGVKGVTWHKKAGKWMAQLQVRRKINYLGLFDSIHEAEKAVVSMRNEIHGEFANHG